MRKPKGLWFLVILSLTLVLASCGRTGGHGGTANPSPGGTSEPTPAQIIEVKVFDQGEIIRKDGNQWLITAYMDKGESSYIDAYSLAVNEKTVLQDASGRAIPAGDMAVGAQVEVWHNGSVKESYPAQTSAAKIVLRGAGETVPGGMIGRTAVVQAALADAQNNAANGTTAAWAVKKAALDAENGYWNVELVRHEAMDQPVPLRVDARTGQMIPVPVAENESFRVFAPKPGTVAGSPITVEGEARVFEAAFSWQLEDGHNILAEGHEMADGGAPAWGKFKFDVSYDKASQPNMMLILFVYSAKDGSVQQELIVPLQAPEDRIQYHSGKE